MIEKNPEENKKSEVALKEEKILEFWNKNEIFKKTLEKETAKGEFVFYEGPPTANAKPALHHLEARVFKDIIPRYKTMSGFYVRRKAGWDTHGLPVELQIEKKLGLTSKKDIETYGVEKFNKECKDSVFEYIHDWEKFTDRIGYWVDKKDAYYTFDTNYIESVWNVLKNVNEKGLLYKDYKVLPWCPRCGTALSSHELAQGYQDDKDLSVTAKFKFIGQENTYILAWTTTPWTLPGNVALAVGNDIDYVKIKVGEEFHILAKERLSVVTAEYEVSAEMKGKDLVGWKYEPLYNFFSEKFNDKNPEAFTKSFQVYPADFVTTTDGTGVVHTAVMYGQDDFLLGTQLGLPKYHLVKEDGTFLDDMDFLSNRFVKDEEVAVDVIKDLAHRGLLFKKEKYEHSYPHCWRCKTPLIYYARDSWYIAMSKLRGELVAQNEDIKWEPEHIKEGRFGEWLKEIKDWAISRERYWGTPLPIWVNKDDSQKIVVDSIETLKKYSKNNGNSFIFIRHGESEHNVQWVCNSNPSNVFHLTDKGKQQIEEVAGLIGTADVVYTSPFVRTRETADILADKFGLDKNLIIVDERLREVNFGDFDGKSFNDFLKYEEENILAYDTVIPGGESYNEAKIRFGQFLYEINEKYFGKTIVVSTHGIGLETVSAIIEGAGLKRSKEIIDTPNPNFEQGGMIKFKFTPLPHNNNFELDLHRPYIDGITLLKDGEEYSRVREVLDVWFDSGAMPFAQSHYPFEGEKIAYPADFISEAIDQTRGWFYTLHAIGVLMGMGRAFKNVICLGHILDKEGKKMSKSIGNIVEPLALMDKYGVDALRFWMYTVNSPGDSKNFDEKTVDEILKKVFNPILNIVAFYELYKDDSVKIHNESQNILDKWILSRLNETIKFGTENLDKFKVFESARPVKDFVNDFSTWYVRRSRDRFKSEDMKERNDALSTTAFVLLGLVKYMAPFTPFFSEQIYLKLKTISDSESVHLCDWPKSGEVNTELLSEMQKVREVVTGALELRQKSGHKVRQPLSSLTVPNNFSKDLMDIISDEVNVKSVVYEEGIIKLDTDLTEGLKNEGVARDVIRAIQDARKQENLKPSDSIEIVVFVSEKVKSVLSLHLEMIKTPTQVNSITYSESAQKYPIEIEGETASISIVK